MARPQMNSGRSGFPGRLEPEIFKPHVRDAPNSRFGPRGVVQIFPCSSKGRADCHSCGHQRGDISRNRHSQPAYRGLGRLLSSGHH